MTDLDIDLFWSHEGGQDPGQDINTLDLPRLVRRMLNSIGWGVGKSAQSETSSPSGTGMIGTHIR
jgi:hypothetical protein